MNKIRNNAQSVFFYINEYYETSEFEMTIVNCISQAYHH